MIIIIISVVAIMMMRMMRIIVIIIHSSILFTNFGHLTGILVPLTILKAGVLEAKWRISVRMVPVPLFQTLK